MPFPQVLSVTETSFSSVTTAHLVDMPATVDAGDLLLMLCVGETVDSATLPSGWTVEYSFSFGTSNLAYCIIKIAIGDEDGTTVDVVTNTATTACAQVFRITSWEGSLASVEQTRLENQNSNIPDPPSHSAGWGAEDTLWIAAFHAIDDDETVSAFPTSYVNGVDTITGGGTNTGGTLGSATRELNAASENPAIFTLTGSERWSAITFAIRPSSSLTEQEGFRFRNDDGSESAATFRQSQDVNDSVARNVNIRLRLLVNATGDPDSEQYQLEYKETGDAASEYRAVPLT